MMLAATRRSASRHLPAARRRYLAASLSQLRAPQDPYRGQSNVPVRRGVLRFRNCVRPSPRWRRYRSRHAARLKSRSLLLKEPEHGWLPFPHAQPPEGCLLNPRPLDAQFVERLLIVRRELFFLDLLAVRLQVAHDQVRQIARNRNLAFDLRRFPQQLRYQQPPLPIHFDQLPVIIHPVQELLLRRIEGGEPRQFLLDPLPFLEGIYLCNLPVLTRDVKLQSILLVDHSLEFGRDLQPSLFVDASWVIAAKHVFGLSLRLQPGRQKRCKVRSNSGASGDLSCFWVGFPPAPLYWLLIPTHPTVFTTSLHFVPHLTRKSLIVKPKLEGRGPTMGATRQTT